MPASTLPAAAPMPPLPALPDLPLPPQGGFGVEAAKPPVSSAVQQQDDEAASLELQALRAYVRALHRVANSPSDNTARPAVYPPILEPTEAFTRTLVREWARAKEFWLPLSLMVVKLADSLDTEGTRRTMALHIEACCREVDVAFELPTGGFAIIMLATNRTGAEAERLEMRRALNHALLHVTGVFPSDTAAVGIGVAIANDDAATPHELVVLAEQRATAAVRPTVPEVHEDDAVDSSATTQRRPSRYPASGDPEPGSLAGTEYASLESQDYWTLPAVSTTERHTPALDLS